MEQGEGAGQGGTGRGGVGWGRAGWGRSGWGGVGQGRVGWVGAGRGGVGWGGAWLPRRAVRHCTGAAHHRSLPPVSPGDQGGSRAGAGGRVGRGCKAGQGGIQLPRGAVQHREGATHISCESGKGVEPESWCCGGRTGLVGGGVEVADHAAL